MISSFQVFLVYLSVVMISSFASSSYADSITAANATDINNHNHRGCLFSVVMCPNIQLNREESIEAGDKIHLALKQVNSTKLKDWVDNLSSFHTRHTQSEFIESAAYWLKKELQSACGGGVYFHNYTQIDKETSYNLKNIICNKEGSMAIGNTNPLILISAHYDNRMQNISQTNARAPGADDNASGVAAILELARILSKVNLKNNIQFVLFSGEEQGQWGSTVYAKHLQANDTRFNTVVNLDMIGYPPHGLNKIAVEYDQGNKITTNDIYSKNTAHFIENIASEYTNLETSLHSLGKTDLIPFEATGNIVIGLHDGGSELNPNYHNVSDTPSTLDIEYLASVTKLALATILNLDELDHTTSLFSAQNDRIMKEYPVYG
jgi:hypothetical protein